MSADAGASPVGRGPSVAGWLALNGARIEPVLPHGAIFDHVAHAAPRIRDLLPIYRDLLGGTLLRGGTHALGFRDVQLGYGDGSKVELIEPTREGTFLDSFFERQPLGGLHHVTFLVPDVRAAAEEAERAGMRIHGASYEQVRWREAFLHPAGAAGALIQLAQPGPAYRWADPDADLEAILAGEA